MAVLLNGGYKMRSMKKGFILTIAFMLVLSMFTANITFANDGNEELNKQASNGDDYIEGQLVVSIEPKKEKGKPSIQNKGSIRSEEARLNNRGFSVVDSIHSESEEVSVHSFSENFNANIIDHMGLVYLVEYNVDDYKHVNKAKQELRKELRDAGYKVRYISKNYTMEVLEDVSSASTQMHPNQEWHYNMVNAPQAWNITTGSSAVKIAVLDTGIDHNHPNLANITDESQGASFVGGNTMDVQGHGTHVAGTIASYGSVSGVMQNATLVPVKVLGDDGSGSMYGITQGILYAADIGSDVINMSLGGGGYNQSMDEAIQTAVNSGTIVIAASGNDSRSSISYPAAYDGAIAVGSVTSNGTRSNFSNYGNGLELMAPGSSIYSTYPNSQYRTLSGTSMAAPHAAGVAGLIRAVNPNISVADARQILQNTAQNAGSSFEYGHGIVDAHAAVVAAGGGNGGTDPDPGNITVTEASTNSYWISRGQNVTVEAQVTDENGSALANANVEFVITRPNGATLTNTVSTNSNGYASWTLSTSWNTATGEYQVSANTTLSGYDSSSDTTSFYVY